MEIKQLIEIIITDMKDGKITGFMLDNKHFVTNDKPIEIMEEKPNDESIQLPIKKYRSKKRSMNKVDKWIKEKNIKKFDVKDYFGDYPDDYYTRRRIEFYISKMVADKTLVQVGNDTFFVNKKVN